MNSSDVKTQIDRYISNNIIALSSQNNDLNSPKINSVINTYFLGNITGSLQLVNGDTATIENEQVIYQLSLDTQNFFLYKNTSTIEAKITFFIHNDVVEFTITKFLADETNKPLVNSGYTTFFSNKEFIEFFTPIVNDLKARLDDANNASKPNT